MKEPIILDINTQKDEIIARLLLQRYYSGRFSGLYSKNEALHIAKFTIESDKTFYDRAFIAVNTALAGNSYHWLIEK